MYDRMQDLVICGDFWNKKKSILRKNKIQKDILHTFFS